MTIQEDSKLSTILWSVGWFVSPLFLRFSYIQVKYVEVVCNTIAMIVKAGHLSFNRHFTTHHV